MARAQVLVQLNDELLAVLDQEAAASGRSRSQLVRDAIEEYFARALEGEIDRRIIEGYRVHPQSEDPAWTAALRSSIEAEPW